MKLINNIIYELSRADGKIADVESAIAKNEIGVDHLDNLMQAEHIILRCMSRLANTELVEVVHGTWKRVLGHIGNFVWECSECSCHCTSKEKFCPNCGARMDGE